MVAHCSYLLAIFPTDFYPIEELRTMLKSVYHIVPVNDLKEHTDHKTCKCEPYFDTESNLVIHNSYDGREFFEGDNKNLVQIHGDSGGNG